MRSLFDSDGLPWTSRVRWGWIYLWVALIAFALAPVIGMYLGLWLMSKGRSMLVFVLYALLTCGFLISLCMPERMGAVSDLLASALAATWVTAAFVLRHQVTGYYEDRGHQFQAQLFIKRAFRPLVRRGMPESGLSIRQVRSYRPG